MMETVIDEEKYSLGFLVFLVGAWEKQENKWKKQHDSDAAIHSY